MLGNKIANKITKDSLQNNWQTCLIREEKSIQIPKQRHIFPEEQQEIINEVRFFNNNTVTNSQKRIEFWDNTPNQPLKFRIKIEVAINDAHRTRNIDKKSNLQLQC